MQLATNTILCTSVNVNLAIRATVIIVQVNDIKINNVQVKYIQCTEENIKYLLQTSVFNK